MLPASTVYTDELKSYRTRSRKRGYAHPGSTTRSGVYVSGDVHTNTIEGFWSLVKRGIGGVYHSVSAKHLQGYLNEYAWRYNQRNRRAGRCSTYFSGGRSLVESFGFAAFRRTFSHSSFDGTGISVPFGVVCFDSIERGYRMSDRLIGCFIKFDRALAHLEVLNDAIEGFKKSQVDRIPGKFDADRGKYVFRMEGRAVPKREWSGVIGDVLHNFRATLDYLAWELVDSHTPGGGTGKTEFPIFIDRKLYEGSPRKTKGMSPGALAVVERLQPFNESPRDLHPSENLLWILQSLVTADKHRSLTLTAEAIGWHLEGLPPDVYAVDTSLFHEDFTTTTVTLDPGDTPERYVNVEFVASSDVCFAPRGPTGGGFVLPTLRDIGNHIRDRVIPPLRQFLNDTPQPFIPIPRRDEFE